MMKWLWRELGGHTHVDIFMNGANCGRLTFRNEEFAQLRMRIALEHGVGKTSWVEFEEAE